MLTVCPIGYGFGFPTIPVVVGYSGRPYLEPLPFGLTGAYSVGVRPPFNFPSLYGHSRGHTGGYGEGGHLAAYSSSPCRSSARLAYRGLVQAEVVNLSLEPQDKVSALSWTPYPTVKVQASAKLA